MPFLRLIQQLIVWYFLIGAVAAFFWYLYMMPGGNFFLVLIPNLIATGVFLFYMTVCYLYLKNFGENSYKTVFVIMLLLQSLRLYINGYIFVNCYMPNIALQLNLKDPETITVTGNFFKLSIGNGYFKNNNSLIIAVNFVGILLMIVSSLKTVVKNTPALSPR